MTFRHASARPAGPRQEGSILLLVLFACLSIAVVIQTLSAAIVCAERALVDESGGRARMKEKDEALSMLPLRSLHDWTTQPWAALTEGPPAVAGRLTELQDSAGWVMRADVRQEPSVSMLTTSAWIERGRDGIDLPMAAFVARNLGADPARELPCLETESADPVDAGEGGPGQTVVGYLVEPVAGIGVGPGCSLAEVARIWELDAGWRSFLGGAAGAVVPAEGVATMHARAGRIERLPLDCGGMDVDSPMLVVLTGGADLDARGRGDLHGVIVVDQGGVLLEGTTLHGAVFVTEELDLGFDGQVVYSRSLVRWATDRSLVRARLVPGSRWEGTE